MASCRGGFAPAMGTPIQGVCASRGAPAYYMVSVDWHGPPSVFAVSAIVTTAAGLCQHVAQLCPKMG